MGDDNSPLTQSRVQDGAINNYWKEDKISLSSLLTSRGEKGTILSKLSEADKNMMKALIKISTLSGGDETAAQLIETIISEQAKMMALVMEQAQ